MAIMYKILVEVIADNQPGKLISLERVECNIDPGVSDSFVVTKINQGEELGMLLPGDRFLVLYINPAANLDETSYSIQQMVSLAGTYVANSYYSTSPDIGLWTFYD